ncbi:helix-turn-helix domain-containing protein [Haloarchaeobius amylolyticus]|uniref:helix-turn-helix domain-containing protein n=1 Tax=Haloarchaeobius amylolyticus TaxID=1198296 RepID=UPI00226E77BD|nr:helix-turn-helix domain-containing protein [Haloarchaeobius amylolyticus]
MSVFVDFVIESPILQTARKRAPGMTYKVHDLRLREDGIVVLVFEASGGDYGALEAGMEDDETLADYRVLSESDGRRMYRVTLSEASREQTLYPFVVDHDIYFQTHTATATESRIQATFASEETFQEFTAYCERRDIPVTVRRILREHPTDADTSDGAEVSDLTPAQREALEASVEAGYYEVPRQATLEDVADELGVSSQATSERLRRGMRTVLNETIVSDDGERRREEPKAEIR